MARDLDEGTQRDAVERRRVAAPQGVQVNPMTVVGGHHGQAGEAAFGRFRLPNDGQMTRVAEFRMLIGLHPHAAQRACQPTHQ